MSVKLKICRRDPPKRICCLNRGPTFSLSLSLQQRLSKLRNLLAIIACERGSMLRLPGHLWKEDIRGISWIPSVDSSWRREDSYRCWKRSWRRPNLTRRNLLGTFPNLGIDSPWQSSSLLCIDVTTVQWEHHYRSQSSTHRCKTEAKQEDLWWPWYTPGC